MDQTVELFCGDQKPFSSIARSLGYATFTVDQDPASQADLVVASLPVSSSEIPQAPLIVWASPPDSSTFTNRACWENDGSFYPLTHEAEIAIGIIRNTISAITALKPKWWFLESPKSLLRSMPLFAGFNRGYPSRNRLTIKHNEFGGKNAAESDVWTNAYWWIPRPGSGSSERESADRRVPPFAIAQMLEQLNDYKRTGTYGPQ